MHGGTRRNRHRLAQLTPPLADFFRVNMRFDEKAFEDVLLYPPLIVLALAVALLPYPPPTKALTALAVLD